MSEPLVVKYYNNKHWGSNNHVDLDYFSLNVRDLYGVMYLSRMGHHKIHTLKTEGSKLLIT
jgi:hypothetical protein